MAKTALIQLRVEDEIKEDAETLFSELGIDTPTAIRMFLKQAIACNGIPFAISRNRGFYNPHNQKILQEGIKELNSGKGQIHELLEVGDD